MAGLLAEALRDKRFKDGWPHRRGRRAGGEAGNGVKFITASARDLLSAKLTGIIGETNSQYTDLRR